MNNATVIAVANHKGGPGKTTTVKNLALCLLKLGHNVTVLDMDGQANLTDAFLGTEPGRRPERTLADVLDGKSGLSIGDVLIDALPSRMQDSPTIQIAPSDAAMDDTADDLVTKYLGTLRLKSQIEQAGLDGIVLIDCPPNLGSLTFSALIAAQYVVVPTKAEQWSINGVGNLRAKLGEIQAALGWSPVLLGTVATMVDERTLLHRTGLAQLRVKGMPALLGVIPERKGENAEAERLEFYMPVVEAILKVVAK